MTHCDVFVGGMVIGVECFVDVRDGSFDSAASSGAGLLKKHLMYDGSFHFS